MNEEMESTVLDTSGDDTSSVADTAPVDASSSVTDAPEPDTVPETDSGSPSMEVISVDELLDRLTAGEEIGGEETSEALEEETGEEIGDSTELPEETGPSNADTALELLEVIQEDVDHPFLTTDFADYTVTEGLLLMALLLFVISLCIKMLKEGFSWL